MNTYFVNPDVTPFVSVITVLQVLHLADHFLVPASLKSTNPNLITAGWPTGTPTFASFEAILSLLHGYLLFSLQYISGFLK